MDRRVTLQRKSETDDGLSTVVNSWTTLATVWAKLMPLTSAERFAAGEVGAYNRATFMIRRDSAWDDLSAKDRLTYGGAVHDILGVREHQRRFFMVDTAVRGDG